MKTSILIIFCALVFTGCGVNRIVVFSRVKNILPPIFRRIIPFTGRFSKNIIPVFIGTPAKTAWIIILKKGNNN
jgi:hypothetical protein